MNDRYFAAIITSSGFGIIFTKIFGEWAGCPRCHDASFVDKQMPVYSRGGECI